VAVAIFLQISFDDAGKCLNYGIEVLLRRADFLGGIESSALVLADFFEDSGDIFGIFEEEVIFSSSDFMDDDISLSEECVEHSGLYDFQSLNICVSHRSRIGGKHFPFELGDSFVGDNPSIIVPLEDIINIFQKNANNKYLQHKKWHQFLNTQGIIV